MTLEGTIPIWIDDRIVGQIHHKLIGHFGGLAGIRDAGLLDAALQRPRHAFAYGQSDVFVLASLYASAIIRNHPFLDGNKRVGFMLAYIFLAANGQRLIADQEDAAEQVIQLASGRVSEADFADWLQRHCRNRA